MRRAATFLGCAGLVVPAAAAAQTRASLRAELGTEYDTNATRAETVDTLPPPPVVSSALVRAVVAADLARRVGDSQDLTLAASLGGKAFAGGAARSENVVVGQGSGLWRLWLGRRVNLGASGSYFDAVQQESPLPRDFRAGNLALRAGVRIGDGGSAGASGGYRWFEFKSDHAFDFQAPVAGADYRHVILTSDESAEWEIAAGAAYEPRAFEGRRWIKCDPTTNPDPTCLMSTTEARRDRFGAGHVELLRVGAVLLGAGYGIHVNDSNSYGESLLRHVFILRAAAKLPLDVFVSAKLEALATRYQDAIYFGTDPSMRPLSIDDETKDSFRAEATRDVGERWQVVARYTLHTNRIDTRTVHYSRQTFMLGLAFAIDR